MHSIILLQWKRKRKLKRNTSTQNTIIWAIPLIWWRSMQYLKRILSNLNGRLRQTQRITLKKLSSLSDKNSRCKNHQRINFKRFCTSSIHSTLTQLEVHFTKLSSFLAKLLTWIKLNLKMKTRSRMIWIKHLIKNHGERITS